MVQLPWSDFFKKKIQFTKYLGLSLGVNRMWAQRNDHASKRECVDSFNICPKRTILGEEKSNLITLLS